MKYEKLTDKSTSYGLNISGGVIDSLRINSDLKTVIRVYDNGKIGVAGRIGEGDDNELLEQAKSRLDLNIAYPSALDKDKKRDENNVKHPVPPAKFLKTMQNLLKRLNKTYPDFVFSNKINMGEETNVYENSENTKYTYSSDYLMISLVLQHKKSSNIMDLGYGCIQNYYDEDKIVEEIGKLVNVYETRLELDDTLPIILDKGEVLSYWMPHLSADLYMSGASLFSGKLGQKLFSDKFSVYSDSSPDNKYAISFFDAEGVVKENDKFYYVKDGVVSGLATYKRTAHNFNLPLSGSANADFDSVPSAGFGMLKLAKTAASLKDLVKGKAIYISQTSGGDMTPDGTLGIPVQLAYLYEDGKLVGRLPEFSINANIFDLFGKDLIGVTKNDVFDYMEEDVLVGKFKINK